MVDRCLRRLDFLDAEVRQLDRVITWGVHASGELLRLRRLLGVRPTAAATLMPAIGDAT
jgi:hypothetical protein